MLNDEDDGDGDERKVKVVRPTENRFGFSGSEKGKSRRCEVAVAPNKSLVECVITEVCEHRGGQRATRSRSMPKVEQQQQQ